LADIQYSRPQQGINGYSPRKQFQSFHNRLQRWAILVCHRRAGKTVACIADLVLSALFTSKADARFAYIAPLYNQAKDVAWLYVKILTADIPGIEYNESELRADFPNGSRIRLYGADNPDRMRGIYLDGAILDEYADMKPSMWGEVIRPALSDRKGWAVFIGTPKGHNEFFDLWQRTEAMVEWFRLMLKASESGLIDRAELAAAKCEMTDDQYDQEFECSFQAAIQGAYYGKELNILESKGQICSVPYDTNSNVYAAFDIGWSDDTSIWWWQVINGEIHVIDHFATNGENVLFYVAKLRQQGYKYAEFGGKPFVWLPHDARAKTLAAAGKSVQEQFLEAGFASRIVPELSLQDGIQAVRMTLPISWFDRDNTKDGRNSLSLYRREWDEDRKVFREKPLHDWTSHDADSFRMLAVAWREEMKPKEPPKVKYPQQQTVDEIIKKQRQKRINDE
jgi:phage terminase large subunit